MRIVVVDDECFFRESMKQVLALQPGLDVVAEAPDAFTAFDLIREHKPDVVVMDLVLPEMDGVRATAELKRRDFAARVLLLSCHKSATVAARALAAGACGYALKDESANDLMAAIRTVGAGGTYLAPQMRGEVLERPGGLGRARAHRASSQPLVLVVDDDDDVRSQVSTLLQAEGYAVAAVDNGRSALEYLETHTPPGLILLDLEMPVMGGWAFCQERRRRPSLLTIPVVLMSASTTSKRRCESLRVAGILCKPVDVSTLLRELERHLRAAVCAAS